MHDSTVDPQIAATSEFDAPETSFETPMPEATAPEGVPESFVDTDGETAAPAEDWQHNQVTVIWKGVETVMRHMIGLLDKIDAGVEGLQGVGTERVGRALEDNATSIERMRKQLREGIARLDHQLVVYAAQSTAEQQDMRRQMRALESQITALAAAQKAPAASEAPAWIEGLMSRIEEQLSAQATSAAQERIADLELQISALQRQINEAARPDALPLDGAAQEIRLLLAELIAIQERDQKEGRQKGAQTAA